MHKELLKAKMSPMILERKDEMSYIPINIFDRDRAGGFVPFSSGFGPTHLISLLDVQVPMHTLEIH